MPSSPRSRFGVSVTVEPAPVPPTISSCSNKSSAVFTRARSIAKQPRLVSSGLPIQLNLIGS